MKWNRFICFALGIIMTVLCAGFASMEVESVLHVSELVPASASLISPEFSRSTQNNAEELTSPLQMSVHIETDQRLRQQGSQVLVLVIVMLAVLLANTVFYKAKKHLLTRNDADGRRFIICYIHHQDGQKH